MKIQILLVMSACLSMGAVAQVNGKANATGTCVVAHSGNNDVINFDNCGIGKEQADKILSILNSLLQAGSREKKLDEIINLLKQRNNPYGDVTTYSPEGLMRKKIGLSTDAMDGRPEFDFHEMLEADKAKNWLLLLEKSQGAITHWPGWFTPYFFLGKAQGHLCRRNEAIASITKFIDDTDGATDYSQVRSAAQSLLTALNTPKNEFDCTPQKR